MDRLRHIVHLFVDIKFEGSSNNLLETKSDNGLSWYFHMAKDDSDMKYLLIITYDKVSLVDVTVSTPRITQISSSSVGMKSDILEVGSNSKSSGPLSMFEIGSSSSNNIGSSTPSHVLTSSFSNSPSCDDVEGYLVDPNKLDDNKEKYMFANKILLKILLQKALDMFVIKNNFEFETVKSSPDRLMV
ncbi:hypothetical protein PanWU01x14_230460 [Parasponia andersonii]|uniref:Uncharacterized protein n=1 Tax=Parasponia andersonii TaxID=3476 RepID=A0A2P5BKR6_PARAD|nr:hypothetical protein PanWU01x14_230460 [Parasponia andersonii]